MDRSIDFIVIAIYLVFITLLGSLSGGKQKTIKDYFLGADSVPWWAVCFSIIAAETSTLTFISIPGLSYLTNFNFLQLTFGYLIGRIIVAVYFLPSYFDGELTTAYSFLEKRFGTGIRSGASIVFMFTRTLADGVRLYATAIPLKFMLDIDYPEAILIISVFAILYTLIGGVKGIIWVDVVQLFIYLGGAIISIIILSGRLDAMGAFSFDQLLTHTDKLEIFNFGFDLSLQEFFKTPYTLFGGIIGGMFLSMASHGTDHLIVQRLLTTKDLNKSRKALTTSGVIIIIQFLLFLIVGFLLYGFYGETSLKGDEIFSKFIIEQIPVGLRGFIIAGLFAAALSTLAGSISALSSSTMFDIIKPIFKKYKIKNELRFSRMLSLIWACVLSATAFYFISSSKAVVEIALSIASFTYGGLLGVFVLGVMFKKIKQFDAMLGFFSAIVVMIIIVSSNIFAWTWYILIGVVTTILIGNLSYYIKNKLST